jgi:thiol-disulfide isomerase/thioredoxin
MNIRHISFVFCLLFTATLQANVSEGSSMPTFSLNKLNGGGSVSSSSLRGRVTLVDFWASWCVPCRLAVPALEKLHNEGINVISITIDKDAEKAISFMKKYNVSYTVLQDPTGSVAGQFGLPTMPTSFLIDKSGKVIKIYPGFKSGDEETMSNDAKQAR